MSKIILPPGSTHGLQIINKLSENYLTDLSTKILDALPIIRINELFPDSIIQKISAETQITKAELNFAIKILIALWKQTTFSSIKAETFKSELTQLSLNEETIECLLKIWKNSSERVLNSLRNISHSGIPELEGINWSILLERATCYEPKKRELRALLQLETDQGKKYTKMTENDLQKLHYTLQTIQKKLDTITK
uniref:COMM domain-containing protein n=1 Tax=Panagrolaimus sp. PS1159 TaxID=55785 RepID=A0AC35FBA8_9BILA